MGVSTGVQSTSQAALTCGGSLLVRPSARSVEVGAFLDENRSITNLTLLVDHSGRIVAPIDDRVKARACPGSIVLDFPAINRVFMKRAVELTVNLVLVNNILVEITASVSHDGFRDLAVSD